MAEFAASILGIVSCGAKVTLVLSQIASDVGSAGKEARMIGSEIRSFCAIIKTLGDTLGKIQASQYYNHCADLIEPMTETSMEMFTELLNATDQLKGITKGKDKKDDKFSLVRRVQWAVFQKPKIMVLRAAIEAYKSNLALMLATLNTAEKVARVLPTQLSEDLLREEENDRSLLQSLELEHRASMLELAEVEQEYRRSVTGQASETLANELTNASLEQDEASSTDPPSSYESSWVDDLVGSARQEIESIRSSLSSSSAFDIAQIQGQVSRQSKTLSLLIAEDHQRISQRWSSVASLSIRHSSYAQVPDSSQVRDVHEYDAQEQVSAERPVIVPQSNRQIEEVQEPFYTQVITWLMLYTDTERSKIMKGIEHDIKELSWTQRGKQATEVPKSLERRAESPEAKRIQDMVTQQLLNLKPSTWSSHYVEIDLSYKQISDLPADIFDERSLMLLKAEDDSRRLRFLKANLSHNTLVSLPPTMHIGFALRTLDLKHNRMREFPIPILESDTLEHVDLSHNQLQSLPVKMPHMTLLKVLNVEYNSIRGLPLAIGDLPRLHTFKYGGNPIYFPSPAAIESFMPNRFAPTPQGADEVYIHSTKRLKAFLKMTFKLSPDAERAIKGIPPDLPSSPLPLPPTISLPINHTNTNAPISDTDSSRRSGRFSLAPSETASRRQSGMWSHVTITRPLADDRFDFPSFAGDQQPKVIIEQPEPEKYPLDQTSEPIPVSFGHRKAQSHDESSAALSTLTPIDRKAPLRFSYDGLKNPPNLSASETLLSGSPEKSTSPVSPAPAATGALSHKPKPSLNVFERADELLNRAKRKDVRRSTSANHLLK